MICILCSSIKKELIIELHRILFGGFLKENDMHKSAPKIGVLILWEIEDLAIKVGLHQGSDLGPCPVSIIRDVIIDFQKDSVSNIATSKDTFCSARYSHST